MLRPLLDDSEQVQHHYNQDDYHHYGDDACAPHARPPRILSSRARCRVLEKAREQQNGDYHQDDHHQYVNQVARPHAPTSLSTHRLQGRPQNDQYEKDHYKDSDYCAERPVYPP